MTRTHDCLTLTKQTFRWSSSAHEPSMDSSSECWDDGVTCDSQDHGEFGDDGCDSETDGHGHSGLLWVEKVWLSDEERLRTVFKRIRNKAQKMGIDRSPFFPKTTAEYAGLRADIAEAAASDLRSRIEEREKRLRGRKQAHWKTIYVVGSSGRIEARLIPVYHYPDEDESAVRMVATGETNGE